MSEEKIDSLKKKRDFAKAELVKGQKLAVFLKQKLVNLARPNQEQLARLKLEKENLDNAIKDLEEKLKTVTSQRAQLELKVNGFDYKVEEEKIKLKLQKSEVALQVLQAEIVATESELEILVGQDRSFHGVELDDDEIEAISDTPKRKKCEEEEEEEKEEKMTVTDFRLGAETYYYKRTDIKDTGCEEICLIEIRDTNFIAALSKTFDHMTQGRDNATKFTTNAFWRYIGTDLNPEKISEHIMAEKRYIKGNTCGVCNTPVKKGDWCSYAFSKEAKGEYKLCRPKPYHLPCMAYLKSIMVYKCPTGICVGNARDPNEKEKTGRHPSCRLT